MIYVKKAIVVSKLNNTQALTALLREEGFGSVVSAESSEIAKDFIENDDFDLILINTPWRMKQDWNLQLVAAKPQ